MQPFASSKGMFELFGEKSQFPVAQVWNNTAISSDDKKGKI